MASSSSTTSNSSSSDNNTINNKDAVKNNKNLATECFSEVLKVQETPHKRVTSIAVVGDSPLIAIVFDNDEESSNPSDNESTLFTKTNNSTTTSNIDNNFVNEEKWCNTLCSSGYSNNADNSVINNNSMNATEGVTNSANKRENYDESNIKINNNNNNNNYCYINSDDSIAISRHAATRATRQEVFLYDALTQYFLAELYFRGAKVLSLSANNHLLLVLMIDCFHVIDICTLRHVRQQYMYHPTNPLGIIALSQEQLQLEQVENEQYKIDNNCTKTESKHAKIMKQEHERATHYTYKIAYPQNTQNSRSHGITILNVVVQQTDTDSSTLNSAETEKVNTKSSNNVTTCNVEREQEQISESLSQLRVNAIAIQNEIHITAAHHHPISNMSINTFGTHLASASELGNTIKLFDASNGVALKSFMRGRMRAEIFALTLSSSGNVLCALSSNGTLHVFDAHSVRSQRKIKQGCNIVTEECEEFNTVDNNRESVKTSVLHQECVNNLIRQQQHQHQHQHQQASVETKQKILNRKRGLELYRKKVQELNKTFFCKERAISKQPIYVSDMMPNIESTQKYSRSASRKCLQSPSFGYQYKLQITPNEADVWVTVTWPVTYNSNNYNNNNNHEKKNVIKTCNRNMQCGFLQKLSLLPFATNEQNHGKRNRIIYQNLYC